MALHMSDTDDDDSESFELVDDSTDSLARLADAHPCVRALLDDHASLAARFAALRNPHNARLVTLARASSARVPARLVTRPAPPRTGGPTPRGEGGGDEGHPPRRRC